MKGLVRHTKELIEGLVSLSEINRGIMAKKQKMGKSNMRAGKASMKAKTARYFANHKGNKRKENRHKSNTDNGRRISQHNETIFL